MDWNTGDPRMNRKLINILGILCLFVGLGLTHSTCDAQEVDPVTVTATGRGATIGEARKDAIMNALREVVGEYIESDTVIENEEVVTDTITAFSNAESVTSKVLERSFEGDDIVVTCEVTIIPAQLVGRIKDAALSAVNVDGESLAAELAANQDNVQLQKTTLNKLFEGLAPRLLVARLVDRKGRPIKDGRPAKDDIKLSGDEVTIALNIEVYYDLKTYYERVYPNLEKVLRAVASKSISDAGTTEPRYDHMIIKYNGKASTEMSAAFTQYRSSQPKWKFRNNQLGLLDDRGNFHGKNQDPQKFVVLLSQSRDRYGENEDFDAFVLSSDLLETFIAYESKGRMSNWGRSDSYSLPRMRAVLESSTGTVLTQKEIPLCQFALHGQERHNGKREEIPFAEQFMSKKGAYLGTWMTGGDDYDLGGVQNGSRPVVISPRFVFEWCRNDTVLIRSYITMPKEDFEKLSLIRFDFWDPRVSQ